MLNEVKSAFGGSKKFWAALGTAAILASAAIPALAATTGEVTATVTPQNISVTVDTNSVAYGTLALSASNASRTTAVSGTITATNNGNVTETFNIKGSDTTGGSTPWILSSIPEGTGTVAVNQFAHRFDKGVTFTDGEAAALDSAVYKILQAGVILGGTQAFVLQMNMPTSSTDASDQKSTTVTVQAVAS